MTAPGATPPEGSYRTGAGHGQDKTEQSIRNGYRNQIVDPFAKGQDNLWGQGGFLGVLIGTITQGLAFTLGALSEFFASMYATIDEAVTQAGNVSEGLTDLTNRVELLEGGAVTVRSYAFNSQWARPEGLIRLGVAVEGGGSAGRTGSTVAANIGGTGGLSGGYRFQWFEAEAIENDIGETVDVIIGAGGSTPSALGGISRFGPHLQSVAGIGAFLTVEGAALSNSSADSGGKGGNGVNGNTGVALSAGEAGGSSAFGSGGAGGSTTGTRAGGRGSDATISPTTRGNGGSGGGGGGTAAAGSTAGRGGDGGYPAGGGGGGGGRSALTTTDGPGGLGADGRVTVIEYTRPTG